MVSCLWSLVCRCGVCVVRNCSWWLIVLWNVILSLSLRVFVCCSTALFVDECCSLYVVCCMLFVVWLLLCLV